MSQGVPGQGKVGQTLCWHREHALPSTFYPVQHRERSDISQNHGVKENMTPVQRGTRKQTEQQAENMREFQEEEFEKQKCDYKERRVRVN